jgi:hypothetical protein
MIKSVEIQQAFTLVLKYLLMVAIQYNLIRLINTQYRCDYTMAHVGHITL